MCTFRCICHGQHFLTTVKLVRWNLESLCILSTLDNKLINIISIEANQRVIGNNTKRLYGDNSRYVAQDLKYVPLTWAEWQPRASQWILLSETQSVWSRTLKGIWRREKESGGTEEMDIASQQLRKLECNRKESAGCRWVPLYITWGSY